MDYMLLFDSLFSAVPNFALGVVCWIGGWYLLDRTLGFNLNDQLTKEDNPAVGSNGLRVSDGLGAGPCGYAFRHRVESVCRPVGYFVRRDSVYTAYEIKHNG